MFTVTSTRVVGRLLAHHPVVTRRTMLKSTALAGALATVGVRVRSASGYQAAPAATPGPSPVERTQLYDIVVPPTMMPDNLSKMVASFWIIDPGVDATIEQENEAIRGRAMYLASGSLDVSPAVDAPFWKADVANGGDPVVIPAGEAAHLEAGDVFLLPAVPKADLDPAGVVRIVNPGDVEARVFALHLHEAMGQFFGWPDGIRDVGPESEVSDTKKTAEMRLHPMVLRLSEITAVPDTVIPQVEEAEFVGYFVLDGSLMYEGLGGGGATWHNPWPAGQGGWIISLPNVTHTVTVMGDGPARFYELAILSGEPLEEAATPAP